MVRISSLTRAAFAPPPASPPPPLAPCICANIISTGPPGNRRVSKKQTTVMPKKVGTNNIKRRIKYCNRFIGTPLLCGNDNTLP